MGIVLAHPLPPPTALRAAIRDSCRMDETKTADRIIAAADISAEMRDRIADRARSLVVMVRRERLGKGGTLEAAMRGVGGHVVEGVTSCQSVLALAQSYDVEMPLTDAVYRVCHRGLSVPDAIALLLGRSPRPE